jgi:hypothetical protein
VNFTNWRLWIGIGVSGLFLFLLAYNVDLNEIVGSLTGANYLFVVPAISLYFLAVYFRSIRWHYLLSPLAMVKVNRLYPVVIIGYMANNLMPARLGELVRSYYLARRENVSGSSALATIAIERAYDGITLLAFGALSAPVLLLTGSFQAASQAYRTTAIALAAGAIALFLTALAVLTLATSPRFLCLVELTLRLLPPKFRPKARELAINFVGGLTVLTSPRKHLMVFLLSLPVWLLEGSMYLLISYSFGIDAYFESFWLLLLAVILLTATSNLASALPTSVGGIGPFELATQQTLVVLGVGASVGAVYAGFLHLIALWLPVNLVGLVLLWKQNLSLRGLAAAPASIGPARTRGVGRGLPITGEDTP